MALVEIKSTNTYDLSQSDRPFDPEELEAEQKSTKFPVSLFKRIRPVHGTLGYAFRNIKGRNDVVIEAIKNVSNQHNKTHRFIKVFLILWNNMDDYSKKRVDIFDILCEKYDVNKAKFFGIVQEGMFNFNNLMSQTALAGYSPEFIELVMRMARKEKNAKDRQLFADMAGLAQKAPIIGSVVNDNSTVKNELHVHENPQRPSFSQSVRRADEGIRTITQKPQRVLTEGEQNYIDVEVISETKSNNGNEELVDFAKQAEEEFKKLAQEF